MQRVEQILVNLVASGLRFTLEGGIVTVEAKALAEEIEVRVSDTGVGIPPEDLPHIFERFYRGDRSNVPAGVYTLTLLPSFFCNNANGDPDITGSGALTITGAGPGQTIINANGIDRVIQICLGAGTVVITGVTLFNGNAIDVGGGIYNDDADLMKRGPAESRASRCSLKEKCDLARAYVPTGLRTS